jgi:hypothetical protein
MVAEVTQVDTAAAGTRHNPFQSCKRLVLATKKVKCI